MVEAAVSLITLPDLSEPEDSLFDLPTPLAPFYSYILRTNSIPTLKDLWYEYKAMYGNVGQTSSCDISNVPTSVIGWQIYSEYPQMIRRYHLLLKLQESGLFEKVVFSMKRLLLYRIAFEVTINGKTYWVFANDDGQEIDANRLPDNLPPNVFTASLTLLKPDDDREGAVSLYPPETAKTVYDVISVLSPIMT